jgi:hypothetical protein
MASLDWDKLQKLAEDAGFSTEDLEPGPYVARIASTNYKDGAKPRFGIRFVVVGGAHDGKSQWDNINVPDGSGEKGAAIAFYFLEKMKKLGVPVGSDPALAIKNAEGKVFNITVSLGKPKQTGGHWVQVAIGDEVTTAAAPVAAAPVAPPVDVAALQAQLAAAQAAQGQSTPAEWKGERAI